MPILCWSQSRCWTGSSQRCQWWAWSQARWQQTGLWSRQQQCRRWSWQPWTFWWQCPVVACHGSSQHHPDWVLLGTWPPRGSGGCQCLWSSPTPPPQSQESCSTLWCRSPEWWRKLPFQWMWCFQTALASPVLCSSQMWQQTVLLQRCWHKSARWSVLRQLLPQLHWWLHTWWIWPTGWTQQWAPLRRKWGCQWSSRSRQGWGWQPSRRGTEGWRRRWSGQCTSSCSWADVPGTPCSLCE